MSTAVGLADAANSIKIQNDGKIVLAGSNYTSVQNDFALVRYNKPSLTTNAFENQNNSFEVYLNPFSDKAILSSKNSFVNANLAIYNSLGQLVKEINSINGQILIFSRDNLSNGLYFVYLSQDNKMIDSEMVIIND